uniref:translational activator of cytochrome c oxidase 1 isoform X1 n=1 Tax=Agelaius phoeniceus TaxID=39638 RepID=UPI0023EDCF3A|nr:translational activator of cytochrome c oxidase 1 isoform X1 [Agelaius phoeniceus]
MAALGLRAPGLLPPLRAPLRGCLGPCRLPGSPGAVPVSVPVPVPVPVRAMAGHNRWSKVRNVKGPRDAERSRLLEKMARMLRAAAREGGPDPSLNPGLAAVVAQCRTLNVPKATIEGALRSVRFLCAPSALGSVRQHLVAAGLRPISATLEFRPRSALALPDGPRAAAERLLRALAEWPDAVRIVHNIQDVPAVTRGGHSAPATTRDHQ